MTENWRTKMARSLAGTPPPNLGRAHFFALLLDRGDEDLLPPQEGHHGFLVVGHPLSSNGLAVPGLALPDESRHGTLL